MAVWTIKMNIKDKPEAFQFCKENHFIGFGWGIRDKYDDIKTIEQYWHTRELVGLPQSTSLTTAMNALEKMENGDFIWTLDFSDPSHEVYYLCKTTGEYRHLKEHYSEKYGIANCVVCDYVPVGSQSFVPSEAVRLLHSPGIVYQIESPEQEEATELLYQAYEKLHPQK